MTIEITGNGRATLRGMCWLDRWMVVTALAITTGCPAEDVTAADGSTGEGATDGSSGEPTSTAVDDTTGGSDGDESTGGPPPIECDEIEPGGLVPETLDFPAGCKETITNCKMDPDRDGVPLACDNAGRVHNPAQRDADADMLGDAEDLCPVIAGAGDDTFDSDRDGYGTPCDVCPQTVSSYRAVLEAAGVPFGLWVRNVPSQLDTDGDGVGDVCDNCPTVANCGGFGPDSPATVLDVVPHEDPAQCQTDANADGIGDACEGMLGDGAAGPVGFGPTDDFDQDGLDNAVDACPRLWVEAAACAADDDCGTGVACSDGRCNHRDEDGDGVGDACDTCPAAANPEQVESEAGEDADDEDGDFIGAACETHEWCLPRADARPLAFYDVAADGLCCVRTWPGDGTLLDPDGVPLSLDCDGADGPCREVPASVAEATTTLSAGCEAALAAACKDEASPVTLDDVGGDLVAWWAHACQLPPRDQDLDGIADLCDLCPFGHDPANEAYVDLNGMRWPNDGAVCNGDYDIGQLDPAEGCQPGS